MNSTYQYLEPAPAKDGSYISGVLKSVNPLLNSQMSAYPKTRLNTKETKMRTRRLGFLNYLYT